MRTYEGDGRGFATVAQMAGGCRNRAVIVVIVIVGVVIIVAGGGRKMWSGGGCEKSISCTLVEMVSAGSVLMGQGR